MLGRLCQPSTHLERDRAFEGFLFFFFFIPHEFPHENAEDFYWFNISIYSRRGASYLSVGYLFSQANQYISLIIDISYIIMDQFCGLYYCFSEFNMHRNLLGILLKCRFWFSRSRVEPQILHSPRWHWCCFSVDHIFSTKSYNKQKKNKNHIFFCCSWYIFVCIITLRTNNTVKLDRCCGYILLCNVC